MKVQLFFLVKKTKNNLLESLSLKKKLDHLFVLHLLYKLCYEYLLMVWLLQLQNTIIVSSLVFMSNLWVRFSL